jgi:hypothetical protein
VDWVLLDMYFEIGEREKWEGGVVCELVAAAWVEVHLGVGTVECLRSVLNKYGWLCRSTVGEGQWGGCRCVWIVYCCLGRGVPYEGTDLEVPPLLVLTEGALCLLHPLHLPPLPLYLT